MVSESAGDSGGLGLKQNERARKEMFPLEETESTKRWRIYPCLPGKQTGKRDICRLLAVTQRQMLISNTEGRGLTPLIHLQSGLAVVGLDLQEAHHLRLEGTA